MPYRVKFIVLFLMVSLTSPVFSQTNVEGYSASAERIFNADTYHQSHYPAFPTDSITVINNTFRFGERTIRLSREDSIYSILFEKGIFNPDVVFGETKVYESGTDNLSQSQKAIRQFIGNDSLSICCFKSLHLLEPSKKVKRFAFWVFRPGLINPTEYYIEFYNEHGLDNMPLKTFLEGATMTFYWKGTIIL